MDLALALIEEDHGHKVALKIARQLVVYLVRSGGQAQFSKQLKFQCVQHSPLRQLIEWIEDNPS